MSKENEKKRKRGEDSQTSKRSKSLKAQLTKRRIVLWLPAKNLLNKKSKKEKERKMRQICKSKD